MSRIVYLTFPGGVIRGGLKMHLRHVETLRDLGFDAVLWTNRSARWPAGLEPANVPVDVEKSFRPDDVIVVPEDALNAIDNLAGRDFRTVVFCQSMHVFAGATMAGTDKFPPERRPAFISVGRQLSALIARCYPEAALEFVPCFADERVFHPRGGRTPAICCIPSKRPDEVGLIRRVFTRLYTRHADRPWRMVQGATEAQVAEVMARSDLFLSLSKQEAVGLTPLEAMASGALCAGFTGVGGWDYATADNGFWVGEDDYVAAADALAQAADLLATGGPALRRYLDAGRETAAAWSYAAFRVALEEAWMRLAPEARLKNGPLNA